MIDEAKNKAGEHGCKRVLFGLTKWSKPVSEITRFHSGEYLAKVLCHPFKVAAFASPEGINKYAENTAVNRAAWLQIFPDEASAINWLMEGSDEAPQGTGSTVSTSDGRICD